MKYGKFSYIYPPRPKNAAPILDISKYDNGTMIAQPKYNGSNCSIYTDGTEWRVYNRHNEKLTNFNLTAEELMSLYKCEKGQFMVINGEYLNKAKNDEKGALFNHKLIVFDILVYDSDYLLGKTFAQRVAILDSLYGTEESDKAYLYKISDNIYRTKTYTEGFVDLYSNLSKIDLVEGLVIKRADAKLELGLTEDNNSKSQIKFRKKTLNYSF